MSTYNARMHAAASPCAAVSVSNDAVYFIAISSRGRHGLNKACLAITDRSVRAHCHIVGM